MKDILNKIPIIDLQPIIGSPADFSPEEWLLNLLVREAYIKRRDQDFQGAKKQLLLCHL